MVSDKSLSTYAHNVKFIVRNGVVTLRGPVRSEEEKNAINAKAAQIAGASDVKDVKDEITVMPKSWRGRGIYASKREEMRASPCSCKASDGSKYCSVECEAMETTPDLECLCPHAGCKGKIT